MKKFNTIYYLLFILLVMGAFASMAQNSYGLTIMGGVAFVFSILFLIQLYFEVKMKGRKDVLVIAELIGLIILSAILGLRVFYIHFLYVEILFSAAGFLLVLVYLRKMLRHFRLYHKKNNLLATIFLFFHVSIIVFLISLVIVPFMPKVAEVAGIGAMILLIVFLLFSWNKRDIMFDGSNVSPFKLVTRLKDHSIIIVCLFLLYSLYFSLNTIGMLPAIYSDELPRAYYQLVENASLRKEKAANGKYKFEEFKEKYDQFLKHNAMREVQSE